MKREQMSAILGDTISPDDLDNLRHMVGALSHIPKSQWGFRNHFAPSQADLPSMERLEIAGLAQKGRPYEETHYYHATEAGCVAAGLNKRQTEKALNP